MDLPRTVGMVMAAGLDAASVRVMFGAMQTIAGIVYRMPMAVQPLKAVAVLVITRKLGAARYDGRRPAVRWDCSPAQACTT